jgi:hypothetical protein
VNYSDNDENDDENDNDGDDNDNNIDSDDQLTFSKQSIKYLLIN